MERTLCLSTLILWMIATAGLTSIVVDSKLGQPFRDAMSKRWPNSIGYLVTCYQCVGTYSGAACGVVAIVGGDRAFVVLLALAGSAVAQVFAATMNRLEGAKA